MMQKITISIQGRNFELELDSFSEGAKEELIATLHDKKLDAESLLRCYIQEINAKHQTQLELQKILQKIAP